MNEGRDRRVKLEGMICGSIGNWYMCLDPEVSWWGNPGSETDDEGKFTTEQRRRQGGRQTGLLGSGTRERCSETSIKAGKGN